MDKPLWSVEKQLFGHIFRRQTSDYPQPWEVTLGMALMDGSLKVERIPEARELRRVHEAALGVKAALEMFGNKSPIHQEILNDVLKTF